MDDVPAVTALVRSAYRGAGSRAGWTTEADLLDDQRIDQAAVRHKITSEGSTVLTGHQADLQANRELVACCEVARRERGRAYFGMFAVRPTLQAGGIGRVMLAAAEQHARAVWSATAMEMTVIAQRAELIAWYQRRGYHLTGETRPFPFDELIEGGALRDDLYFSVLAKDLRPA